MKKYVSVIFFYFFSFIIIWSRELPKPTYNNSVIMAMTYNLTGDQTEIDAIKGLYDYGIYAPLYFSHFVNIHMDWSTDPAQADQGIQSFKDQVNNFISKAKINGVGLHMTICYGLARNVYDYKSAKEEDIRNAMWYNDNNLASSAQIAGGINNYVFGTFSRYTRKLRDFHKAKIEAMADFLKQVQDVNPDLTIVFSGPGEVEMNYNRISNPPGQPYKQYYFGDYSPFAILEFRDWIKHEGMYATGEEFEGQGYENGGSRYQGTNGLTNFNTDFGTGFTSWDLKYYNWNLSDPYNADPNAIPFTNYVQDGMMPTSDANFINGGFDPPRTMAQIGTNTFYDLWNIFREILVANYVRDMALIVRESGFPKDQYYTHQIPADYLFGKQPTSPYKDPRYYSSASPMWTADAYSDIGMAITLYDVKIGAILYETTKYAVSGISSISSNWGALEYNPEVSVNGAVLSLVNDLYDKIMDLYNNNVHCVSLHKWLGDDYAYKGTNRGTALENFFNAIKDKARQSISTVFTPTDVKGLQGQYNVGTINLTWDTKIWDDRKFNWNNWGDFKEFVIYRGYEEDFTCDASSELGRTSNYFIDDTGFNGGQVVYYKIAGVNVSNEIGVLSSSISVIPSSGPVAILGVSSDTFYFGATSTGEVTAGQSFLVQNLGDADLKWTASSDSSWLSCTPSAGIGATTVTVSVDPTGLSTGIHTATITVSDPNALNSPQTVQVTLNVYNLGSTDLPFGSFDTPINDSNVFGSVPVTGWALDDIEVETLLVKREPVVSDAPGVIGADGLVLIGSAVFVEGARPDVEAAHPGYPLNYRAGGGYMLLTNALPNGGNGTFVLHAIAYDKDDHKVDLGTKTINVDNANAVMPFGAIDTPAQGGEASGASFVNFGWALTPVPNAIVNGTTSVNVLIDGVIVGNATYGDYRSDIEAKYPGYNNSDGAGGHFYIDTTTYDNGVHTISWHVRDDASNLSGIGSRFFSIVNTGTSSSSGVSRVEAIIGDRDRTLQICTIHELIGYIEDMESLRVSRGLSRNCEFIYPDMEHSVFKLNTREVERVVVHLGREEKNEIQQYQGYVRFGNELRRLPIGSTLDKDRGIFYWEPGPGFIGEYELVFINIKNRTKKNIRIIVSPKFDKKIVE